MAKKLISLISHNVLILSKGALDFTSPRLNGIACPKCGKELLDTKPNEMLASMPPKKSISCSSKKCDYTGYRIA